MLFGTVYYLVGVLIHTECALRSIEFAIYEMFLLLINNASHPTKLTFIIAQIKNIKYFFQKYLPH